MPEIPSVLINTKNFHLTQAMATMVLFAVLMLFASIAMIREKDDTKEVNDAAVQKNIKRISPAAWYATGEKMTPKEKAALLKLRKKK